MLLPQLMQNQPALIQNIGSASADMPSPWLALYSACKAFNKSYSQSLQLEVIAQGCDIEVQHIMAANIATQRSKRVESWSEPSPRMFAQSALATVGCGSKVVYESPLLFHICIDTDFPILQLGLRCTSPPALLDQFLCRLDQRSFDHQGDEQSGGKRADTK